MSMSRPMSRPIARPMSSRMDVNYGSGGGAPVLILDTYTAVAAFSTSVRKTGATNASRVRRSSDNSEQDIALATYTADIDSFCGAGNGFATTWYDQSGNARNVAQATTTAQPKVVSSGTPEDGLIYDATDDDLKIADTAALRLTGDLTICLWYKPVDIAGLKFLVTKESASGWSTGYAAYTNGANIEFRGGNGSSAEGGVTATSVLSAGTWIHIACVRSGTTYKIYANGSLANSATYAGTVTDTGADTHIGNRQPAFAMGANGALDDVFFFGSALSDADITAIYEATL